MMLKKGLRLSKSKPFYFLDNSELIVINYYHYSIIIKIDSTANNSEK